MGTTRITLSLDSRVVEETRRAAGENGISRLVSRLLAEYLDSARRQKLREELRQGYISEAESDLEIAHAYGFVDRDSGIEEEG